MDSHKQTYIFLLMTITLFSSQEATAQQTGDDFKNRLRQSLITNELGLPSELKYNPHKIDQYEGDVLKVGPMTKLPTRFDRIRMLNPVSSISDSSTAQLPIKIRMNVTNSKIGLVEKPFDYSVGKLKLVPDARSIYQWTNYTGMGGGIVETVNGIINSNKKKNNPNYRNKGFDIDPVRAFQARKQAIRQEKIDKIKRIYGQDD